MSLRRSRGPVPTSSRGGRARDGRRLRAQLVTSCARALDSAPRRPRGPRRRPGRPARAPASGGRGRDLRCGGRGRGRRHDLVSLRELLRAGLLPLLHHLQVQRPVSAGRPRGGGRGSRRALTARSCRSEYNAFWKCVQAGVTYLFVQLCKVRAPRSRCVVLTSTPRRWPWKVEPEETPPSSFCIADFVRLRNSDSLKGVCMVKNH